MALRFIFLIFLSLGLTRTVIAQTIPTPTQTGTIIIDNGASGKADPNDRIRYKVTIQNTGGASGTGVQLNIVPDPRTTFVPGTFRSSPLAVPDAYACTGNVGLNVPAGSGLKFNDFDDDIAGATCTAGTFSTTQNGSITIAADGSFTYTPPAGFTGTDTYTYTLNDGNAVSGVTITDNALITFTVSNLIWFVDNTGGGSGGAGTLASPFKTLAAFNGSAGPAAGHTIFIKNSGTNYAGGITLKNNQILIGEGHTGTGAANENLSVALSFSLAPNSATLPNIDGTRPVITNSGGDGVTLASDNSLRGFDVGNCSGFGINNNTTNSVGTLTLSEVSINNTTGGGFDVSDGGALTVIFTSISTTGGTYGIDLNNCTGTFSVGLGSITNPTIAGVYIKDGTVTFSYGGIITTNSGLALDIDNHDSNNITFAGSVISTGMGMRVQNCGGGTISFLGASKSLTTGTNTAVDFVNNSGATFNFTAGTLTINTSTGTGFNATGGGTVNIAGGNTIIKTGNGAAININGVNAGASNINFSSVNVTGGTGTAITITTSTGTKSLGDVDVARSGGGSAIVANGAGTLNTTDGTINSGNQLAFDINNTALGMVFTTVSVNGASKGMEITNTTGSFTINGTGTTNASGGTIQNISMRGVDFQSATNVTLKNMTFTNANTVDGGTCNASDNSGCNAAIYLNTVTNVTLDNVDINGTTEQGINVRNSSGFNLLNSTLINCGVASSGTDLEESCLYAVNMSGTCAITNSSLTVPNDRAAVVYNTSQTLALTVTNSTFGMTQTATYGADALEIDSYGASNTTIDIVNSTFVQPKTNGLQVITEGTSTSSVDITGSTFDPGPGAAAALDLVLNNTAHMNFNIINNSIRSRAINTVNVFVNADGTFQGRINNNTTIKNESGSGIPVRVIHKGDGNSKVEIKGNSVTGGNDYGIIAVAQEGTGRLDATIIGNTVSLPSASAFWGIQLLAGASGSAFTNKVCGNVANNITTVNASAIGDFQARAAEAGHEVLLQGSGSTVPANWTANGNSSIPGPDRVSPSGFGTITFGATCSLPTNPNP